MFFIAEADVSFLKLTEAFDVDLIEAIDQDVGHGRVRHQNRQRTGAECFVDKVFTQTSAFVFVERPVFVFQDVRHEVFDEALQFIVRTSQHVLLVHLVDEPLVQNALHRLVFHIRRRLGWLRRRGFGIVAIRCRGRLDRLHAIGRQRQQLARKAATIAAFARSVCLIRRHRNVSPE